jgi:hypothetical protein
VGEPQEAGSGVGVHGIRQPAGRAEELPDPQHRDGAREVALARGHRAAVVELRQREARAPHRLGGGDARHEPVGRGAHEADPAPVEPTEGAQVVDRGREPRERRSVVRTGQVHDAAAGAVLARSGERPEGRR